MKEGLYCFCVFAWQLRLPPAAKQKMDRFPAIGMERQERGSHRQGKRI